MDGTGLLFCAAIVGEALSLPQPRIPASTWLNVPTPVGVANLATRWHEVPLASPGGVAERSEFFNIMIAGGNHSQIKKLLSEARLMRGGDSYKFRKAALNGEN